MLKEWLNLDEKKEIFNDIPNRKANQILIWESFKNNDKHNRPIYHDELRSDYSYVIEYIIKYKRLYGQGFISCEDPHNPLHNLNDGDEIFIDLIYSMIADYNNDSNLVIKNLKDYCYEDFTFKADLNHLYFKKDATYQDKYIFFIQL